MGFRVSGSRVLGLWGFWGFRALGFRVLAIGGSLFRVFRVQGVGFILSRSHTTRRILLITKVSLESPEFSDALM